MAGVRKHGGQEEKKEVKLFAGAESRMWQRMFCFFKRGTKITARHPWEGKGRGRIRETPSTPAAPPCFPKMLFAPRNTGDLPSPPPLLTRACSAEHP